MSTHDMPIPDLETLARRIDACRRELAALRKLYRMARAEQEARAAHAERAVPEAAQHNGRQ